MCAAKNRLANATSPYLRLHASNPVDWYQWGNEAFKISKEGNKPILLSIGYTACHWCHVMAEESFSDPETAAIMNQYFVNIKVDREERPDLDKIYLSAHQLITGRAGGWPLTIFLTPQKIPFYAGTYFPKEPRYGLPSFKQILINVARFYQENESEVVEYSAQLLQALQGLNEAPFLATSAFNQNVKDVAKKQIIDNYDPMNGGFGPAPKFPNAAYLIFLLNYYHEEKNPEVLAVILQTLKKMAAGGIYDQIGGGFFRYAVDKAWEIPHFEKMLYDNAQLLELFVNAFTIKNELLFHEVIYETAEWIINTMQSAMGGYYSTISADSQGIEGKYYYWRREEVKEILTEKEFSLIEKTYGLDRSANFEHHWHLHQETSVSSAEQPVLKSAKQKLFRYRQKRILPAIDHKILTAWNALMIKAMLTAGIKLKEPKFIQSAKLALAFIFKKLWVNDRLLASYTEGVAQLNAYLDDYAFLLDALIMMLQVEWSPDYLKKAVNVAEILINLFYDKDKGGFFFTSHDHEQLIQRPKFFADETLPAGNGIAALNLARLGFLLNESSYIEISEATLKTAWRAIESYPSAYSSLLKTLTEYFHPVVIITLYGNADKIIVWQQAFHQYYLPHHLCFAIGKVTEDLPLVLIKSVSDEGVQAVICQGQQCLNAISSFSEFNNYLIHCASEGRHPDHCDFK